MFQTALDWVLRELQRPLVLFGFAAQFVFFLRSHIPVAFWYLSILGGVMILVYSALEKNLVFTCASVLSLVIYGRNLMLIYGPRNRRRRRQRA